MASRRKKLPRYTLFAVDDDTNPEPQPLVSHFGNENPQPPQPEDATTDTELATGPAVQANQEIAQTLSLLEGSIVEPWVQSDIPITSGSRWNKYRRIHTRDLGGEVYAVLELSTEDDYLIRKLPIAEDEVLSFRKRCLLHKNLCRTHEVFEDGGKFWCVMEPAVVTLRHVRRCPKYPSEEQLVAIAKQMLAGVSYLSSENLFHSRLNTDNVVINSDAIVKITKLEYCEFDRSCSPKNTEAFGRTITMLMDKSADERGEIALPQPHKWSENAVDFLSSTRTWTPDALMRHDFMQQELKLKVLSLHVLYVHGSASMKSRQSSDAPAA